MKLAELIERLDSIAGLVAIVWPDEAPALYETMRLFQSLLSPPDELVEAVARAVYVETYQRCCNGERPQPDDECWKSYAGEARASIAAAVAWLGEAGA